MASTSPNVRENARRVVRRGVYVPATVDTVVGRPGHSGLADRKGTEDLSEVFEELLVRGLAVARVWETA